MALPEKRSGYRAGSPAAAPSLGGALGHPDRVGGFAREARAPARPCSGTDCSRGTRSEVVKSEWLCVLDRAARGLADRRLRLSPPNRLIPGARVTHVWGDFEARIGQNQPTERPQTTQLTDLA